MAVTKTKKTATASKTAKRTAKSTTAKTKTTKTAAVKKKAAKTIKKPTSVKPAAKKAPAKRAAKKVATKKAPAKKVLKKTTAKLTKVPKAKSKTIVAKPKTAQVKKRRTKKSQTDHTAARQMSSIAAEMMMQELAGEDEALTREAERERRQFEISQRLSVNCNRYDDLPNLELAADICFNNDDTAVETLIDILESHDDVCAPDAGRVLAEVGSREPHLVEPNVDRLVRLINEAAPEMLPSIMCALSPLGHHAVDELWVHRDRFWAYIGDVNDEADASRAAAVKLLAAMCAAGPEYARTLAGGLVDVLGKCLPRDVAVYAEAVLPALGSSHSHRAKPVLDRRMKELRPAEVARLRRAVSIAQSGGTSYPAAA